jgi:hypothetical protein
VGNDRYRITAAHPEHLPTSIDVVNNGDPQLPFVRVQFPESVEVHGRVMDEQGVSLGDVSIRSTTNTFTKSDGSFRMRVDCQTDRLRARFFRHAYADETRSVGTEQAIKAPWQIVIKRDAGQWVGGTV